MYVKIAIWVLLTLSTSSLFAQSVKKCDGTVLKYTSEKTGNLNQKELATFFFTFGKECRDNVEYSEWSNELLFDVLEKQTELALTTIQIEQNRIDLEEILDDISSPLLEENIEKLIDQVKMTKVDTKLKQRILEKLAIAYDRFGN